MKKLVYTILSVLLCCCLFCSFGCSNENQKNYDSQIAELERQIEELKTNQSTDYTSVINSLQQKIDQLENQSKSDNTIITELEQQIEELKTNQSTDCTSVINSLQRKIDQLEAQSKSDNDKIAELEQQIEKLKTNRPTDYTNEIVNLQQKIDQFEAQSKSDNDKIAELEQQIENLQRKIQDTQISLLNSYYGFFTKKINEFTYSDFDYSMADTDYTYEIGTEENELLFAKILSGELYYADYLDWFAFYPEYIIRFNEEALNCIEAVIREGAFTEELRAKYFGLYTSDSTSPHLSDAGMSAKDYNISFNDDWTIRNFSITEKISNNEIKQVSNVYDPVLDESGKVKYYRISFSNSYIVADMGDGKTADCTVYVTYYTTTQNVDAWNGEKQKHEGVNFIAECRVEVDFNNVYSGGYEMFDRILIFTEEKGLFDLVNVWEAFRDEAFVPSPNLYPGKSEQKLRFLKFNN